jgi:Asp-tRNA(Asn)/Glu-tRNA(Gln) amidotransferase C subunit
MKDKVYMSDLHFEHVAWNSELSFQKDELKIFQNRLEEVASRWTKKEVMVQVEHFQNNFLRQNEVIDTLKHDINSHEKHLVDFEKEHPIAADHVHFKDHTKFRDEVETQRKLYGELKTEFFRFLTKTM